MRDSTEFLHFMTVGLILVMVIDAGVRLFW